MNRHHSSFGRALQHQFRASDTSYRIRSRMFHVMEEVKTAGFEQVSVSLGIATTDTNCDPQAVRLADNRMYLEQQRKNHYYTVF